jgi:glycosyltransferase involved in cell wall biosynthesis
MAQVFISYIAYIMGLLKITNNQFYILFYGAEIIKLNKLQKIFLKGALQSNNIHIIANSMATTALLKGVINTYAEKIVQPFIEININDKELNNSGKLHILTLTKLIKRKNISKVLKAFEILKERGLKFHHTFAGKGKEYGNLVNLTNELQMQDCITFLGFVNEEQKRFLYNWVDLFILPSMSLKHSIECYGIVVIEANSYNIPVIFGDTGGMKEAIENGVKGYHRNWPVDDIIDKITLNIKKHFNNINLYNYAKNDYR